MLEPVKTPYINRYSRVLKVAVMDVYLFSRNRDDIEVWYNPKSYLFSARPVGRITELRGSDFMGVYKQPTIEALLEDFEYYLSTKGRKRRHDNVGR